MDTRNKNNTFKKFNYPSPSPHPAHFSYFAGIQQAGG